MKDYNTVKITAIFFSKSFISIMLLSFLLIIICDVRWVIDEYVYRINEYSVFYKLLLFRCETIEDNIFFWLYPLIASSPYVLYKGQKLTKQQDNDTGQDIINESVFAFIVGGCMIFVAFMFDFVIMSLITQTTMPVPNDLISGYGANNIFSEVFYQKPRLFVFIWSIVGFFFGGSFSFLCFNVTKVVKIKYRAFLLLMLMYVVEFFVASIMDKSSWKELLYADHLRNDSIYVFIINWLIIVLLGVLFSLLAKTKEKIKG